MSANPYIDLFLEISTFADILLYEEEVKEMVS
jgi:hypothetical protein